MNAEVLEFQHFGFFLPSGYLPVSSGFDNEPLRVA
jgi:hypothetical protein